MQFKPEHTTLVLIGGAGFSGSTLLELLLGQHSQVAPMGEVHALAHPTAVRHLKPTCSCGNDCGRWTDMGGMNPLEIYQTVLEQNHRPSVLVDSSKCLTWLQLAERGARSENWNVVHLLPWKVLSAYIQSCAKRGRGRLRSHVKWMSYHLAYLNLFPDAHCIPLDSLVSTQDLVLARIYALLRLDASDNQISTELPHIVFGSATARASMAKAGTNAHDVAIRSSHRHDGVTPSFNRQTGAAKQSWSIITRSLEESLSDNNRRPNHRLLSIFSRALYMTTGRLRHRRSRRLLQCSNL